MKKLLTCALVLALIFVLAVPAMAAPVDKGPAGIDCDVALTAAVVKDKGNTNTLTITVDGVPYTFTIANNAKAVYKCGGYGIFVGTFGNTKIAELYVVSEPEVEEDYIVDYRTEEFDDKVGANAAASAVKGSDNILTVTVTEDWEKTITTIAIWASGNETVEDVEVEVYQKVISDSITIDNGTYTATYNICGYDVFVRVQGNDLIEYYLV